MNLRKFYRITGSIVAVSTLLWVVALMCILYQPKLPENTAQPQTPPIQPAATAPLDYYLVRSHQNNVAVYEVYTNGAQSLIRTLEIDLSFIREQDKQAFDRGIIIQDKQSLASLIEDFTS